MTMRFGMPHFYMADFNMHAEKHKCYLPLTNWVFPNAPLGASWVIAQLLAPNLRLGGSREDKSARHLSGTVLPRI